MQGRRVTVVIRRPGYPERRVLLQDAETTLGRSDDNTICLPDIGVSRRHALLRLGEQTLTVEDLRSGNGTWLRGDRITAQELHDGDEVFIDPYTVRVEIEVQAAPGQAALAQAAPGQAVPRHTAQVHTAQVHTAQVHTAQVHTAQVQAATGYTPPATAPPAYAPPPARPPAPPVRSADPTLRVASVPALPAPPTNARLEVIQGDPDMDPAYPVPDSGLTLGRSEQRDVILTDLAASRLHAEILSRQGVWWLKDPGSANGVFLNGVRVGEHTLRNGDLIRIGSTELRFVVEGGVEDVEDDGTERTEGFGEVIPGLAVTPSARPATGSFPQLMQAQAPPPDLQALTPVAGVADAGVAGAGGQAAGGPAPHRPAPAPQPTAQAHPNAQAHPITQPLPLPAAGAATAQPTLIPLHGGPPAEPGWTAPPPAGWAPTGAWAAPDWTPPPPRRAPVGLVPVLTALVLILALALAGWKLVHDLQAPPARAEAPPLDPKVQAQIDAEMAAGRELLDDRRTYEAAQRFIRVLRLDPGHAEAERLGYAACEEIVLQELHDLTLSKAATPKQKSETRDRALRQGEAALKGKGALGEAEGLVRLALRMNPGDRELVSLSRKLRHKAREQQESGGG